MDQEEQKQSLKNIVSSLKAANFNTLFFQARPRGDAYYRSAHEPWAENLTGTLGKDPGWDPLAFIVDEAHARGMEVHAWFNVFKVRGPRPAPPSSPEHITRLYPLWTVEADGEVWLDPGIPGVRKYVLRVALDLVRNYDIDGIQFDFIRYPGRTFADDESHRRYGRGKDLENWRRSNIDRFVEEFYDSATALKSMLKIGSAPLGTYDGVRNGDALGSYGSVYQNSQGWLVKKKHDYLVPQVYWNIGSTRGDPDFAEIVRKWKDGAAGRHVYIGIAAYKSDVLDEIPDEIDTTRAHGMDGQAYFRYDNVSQLDMFGGRYDKPANIPPMPWKDAIQPNAPTSLAVAETAPNVFYLEWSPPTVAADGDEARYYNVYRSGSPQISFETSDELVAVTSDNRTHFIDTVKAPKGLRYYYAVSAIDKGNNESNPSAVESVTVKEMLEISGKLNPITALSTSLSKKDGSPTLIAYRLSQRMEVRLEVVQETTEQQEENIVAALTAGERDRGTYVVGLAGYRFRPGKYLIRLTAGDTTLEQPLDIHP